MARTRLDALARAIGTSRTGVIEFLLSVDLVVLSESLRSSKQARPSQHQLIRDAVVLMRMASAMLREPTLQGSNPELTDVLIGLIQRALTLAGQATRADAGPFATCIDI